MFPETENPQPNARPFTLYVRHRAEGAGSGWRPDALVGFGRALRDSGLLADLPGEDVKSLLYLLSFVTANGVVSPAVSQMAQALHLSHHKTLRRMERLRDFQWQGAPLVMLLRSPSGMQTYLPHTGLFAFEEESSEKSDAPVPLPFKPAGREAVIQHSREHYSRPRAEVEAFVLSQFPPRNDPPKAAWEERVVLFNKEQRKAASQLQAAGLSADQAASLAGRYDPKRILRQIEWLPLRTVKSPTGFLIAAIEGDYEAPRGLPVAKPEAPPPDESVPPAAP